MEGRWVVGWVGWDMAKTITKTFKRVISPRNINYRPRQTYRRHGGPEAAKCVYGWMSIVPWQHMDWLPYTL